MAIAQKIGLTGLSPVNRMPALGPVTDLDGLPVEELTEKEPVFYDGGTFYYEDLLEQQNHMQNRQEVTSAKPDRKINTSMVAATTQCFTDAFGISITSESSEEDIAFVGMPGIALSKGVGFYENITRVVRYENMPLGSSLNFSV